MPEGAARRGPSARFLGAAMSDIQRPTDRLKREVIADGGSLLATLVRLWPYIWPSDRRDLKLRVVSATVLLFVAKLATIAVPFTFKWATDALAGHGTAPVAPGNWLAWVFAVPVAMTLAYGGTRIVMATADAMARRHFRQGGHERGAPAGRCSPSSVCTCSRCAFISSARPAG